jgi:hypothetical protein
MVKRSARAEGAVAVREAEAAVELWVVAEALVDAWHADKPNTPSWSQRSAS